MEMQLRQTMLPPPPSFPLALLALLSVFWFRTAAPLRTRLEHFKDLVKSSLTRAQPEGDEDRFSVILLSEPELELPDRELPTMQVAQRTLPIIRPVARTTMPVKRAMGHARARHTVA